MSNRSESVLDYGDVERQTMTQQQQPDDEVLTVGEVAKMIRQTPAWVRAHSNKNRRPYLPGMKMGKYRTFRRSTVLAWMDRLEREAQA